MKVIKEGNWKNPWSKEYECRACHAVLLVEEGDVKPVDYSTGFYCLCALCGERVIIADADLSKRVRDEVGRKRKYSSSSWD